MATAGWLNYHRSAKASCFLLMQTNRKTTKVNKRPDIIHVGHWKVTKLLLAFCYPWFREDRHISLLDVISDDATCIFWGLYTKQVQRWKLKVHAGHHRILIATIRDSRLDFHLQKMTCDHLSTFDESCFGSSFPLPWCGSCFFALSKWKDNCICMKLWGHQLPSGVT